MSAFDAMARASEWAEEMHDVTRRTLDALYPPASRRAFTVPTLVHSVTGEAFLLEHLFDSLDEAQDWLAWRERERLLPHFTD